MSVPGFQEVIGRMLQFMDSMTQYGLFPTDPITSQMRGRAQTPKAQAPEHVAATYQTLYALPMGIAQPVVATLPEPRPAAFSEPQKRLDRWTRLHPPIFGGERHEDPKTSLMGVGTYYTV